jgi:hypothetical protein
MSQKTKSDLSPQIWLNLAETAIKKRNYSRAFGNYGNLIRHAVTLEDKQAGIAGECMCYLINGQFKRAEKISNLSIRLGNPLPVIYLFKAIIMFTTADINGATENIELCGCRGSVSWMSAVDKMMNEFMDPEIKNLPSLKKVMKQFESQLLGINSQYVVVLRIVHKFMTEVWPQRKHIFNIIKTPRKNLIPHPNLVNALRKFRRRGLNNKIENKPLFTYNIRQNLRNGQLASESGNYAFKVQEKSRGSSNLLSQESHINPSNLKYAKGKGEDQHTDSQYVDRVTHLDVNRQLHLAQEKVKELTKKLRARKIDKFTREEVLAFADQTRMKNGKINCSALGTKMKVTYHTAAKICKEYRIE